jgi:glyoxylase-like metal-dependent hydrolase (beta-lactamase superfamily II)
MIHDPVHDHFHDDVHDHVRPAAAESARALLRADHPAPVETPTARRPFDVGDGITVVPSYLPVPGMGVLPANAFVLDGAEPLLVDTGPGGAQAEFRQALSAAIDPAALHWIWLTHTDPDHVGSLEWVLDAAPDARLITTYLAVGKLGLQMEVPMDRLYWVNPGTTIVLGDRRLEALRPPSFDAPETTAFFEHSSRTLFSADSFGSLLQSPASDAADLPAGELADGMALWATIDSPWLTHTDRPSLDAALASLRALGATRVLSSHLPPATGMTTTLFDHLAGVPGRPPWVGPDQAALDALLTHVTA